MCKYCSEFKTGDCNDSITSKKVDIKFGNTKIGELYVDIFINDDKLELYVDNEHGDGIIKKLKKIKYCPFCGQNLTV